MEFQATSVKVVMILLLQCVSSLCSECSKKPGCLHTRLYICCYFAELNDLPQTLTNMTKHLYISKDNVTTLSANMFRRSNLLGLESVSLVETGTRTLEARTFRGLSELRKIVISINEIETILPYTFEGTPFLSYLDLTQNKISKLLPRAFYGLRLLRLLDFSNNELTALSADMFKGMKLENLTETQKKAAIIRTNREIIFYENSISTIKPLAFQYLSFTSLELSGHFRHSIRVLEKNIFRNMTNLRKLKLQSITQIKPGAFSGLKYLVKLSLQEIVIPYIDVETFGDLINLKELDITHFSNSNMKLAKGAFRNLTKLIYLRLDYLGIRSISKGVFTGLGMLQILKLTKQEIRTINNGVFCDLHNLVELDLHENDIEIIRDTSFNGLSKLRKLNLYNNKLKMTSSDIWNRILSPVSNITDLTVDSYLVTGGSNLFEYFPSLKNVSIEGNITKNLIERAGNFKLEYLKISSSLTKIGIDYLNNFNELRELEVEFSVIRFIKPGEFCPLAKLTKLAITFGHITVMKPGTFYGLKQLKELSLMRNSLNEIQEGVFGSVNQNISRVIQNDYNVENKCETPEGLIQLETLDLTYGNISFIHPNAFKGNTNLKKLDLSSNRITTLEYMIEVRTFVYEKRSMLDDLKDLQILILYHNQIATLNITNFQNIQTLQTLTIALNPLKCDCELQKFWLWMEKSHIKSEITPRCKERPEDWRDILTSLNCPVNKIPLLRMKINKGEDITILQVYVAPAALAIIISIGTFGNFVLMLIFILNPDMRSGPNVYIMNLTVADVFNLVVNLPLSYIDNISRYWSLGSVMCQIFIFMRDFSVGLSVYSVVALSIQRYVVIVHPLKFREGKFGIFKGYEAYIHIVVVWIVAGLFAVPSVLSATLQENRCLNVATEYGKEYMRTIWTAQLVVYCVMPVSLILIMYVRIVISLRRSVQQIPGERQDTGRARQRIKLADMVVALTVVFCVSYVPNFLVRVLVAWSVIDLNTNFTLYISFISYCLFFSNTCFNPFALYLISSKFKQLFERYLFFWRKFGISSNHNRFTRLHTVDVTAE